jgi:hypothetical protein
MDFRIGYRRPLRTATLLRKKRQRTRLWLAAVVAVTVAVTACSWEPGQSNAASTGAAAPTLHVALNSKAPAPASASRRIYPYSIVPGGVASRDDIVRRVTTDKVVAEHYASFDVKKAHTVAVETPRAVHVSYRKGDKVYWTAKKVMLAQGETLLTDGTHAIRGRCGNRISDTAMLPVAMNEPSADELDASMNVAPEPGDDGSLQNASFSLDDPTAGNPTSFQRFASFSLPGDAPASAPPTRSSMPGMPAGMPSAMGLGPTRYLATSSSPALVLEPVSQVPGAGTPAVTPDAPVATPGPTTMPETPVTPVFVPDPSTPPLAVTPEGTPLPPVTVNTPDAPGTPVVPVIPVTPDSPVTPAPPVPPIKTPVPEGEIPEPGTLWLFGVAFLLLAVLRNKTR